MRPAIDDPWYSTRGLIASGWAALGSLALWAAWAGFTSWAEAIVVAALLYVLAFLLGWWASRSVSLAIVHAAIWAAWGLGAAVVFDLVS